MRNRKLIYFSLIAISILAILISTYGIINTMVSLKYETENIQDCISNVSGVNLCETITNLKIVIVFSFLLLLCLIYFRKKLLKNEPKNRIENYDKIKPNG
jgi:hypothetical protein